MQQQLDGAVSKQALAMIHAQWKPYKAALKDLIASEKAATSRLECALLRAAELSKRQASSALTVDTGSSAGSAAKTGKKLKVSKWGFGGHVCGGPGGWRFPDPLFRLRHGLWCLRAHWQLLARRAVGNQGRCQSDDESVIVYVSALC